VRSHRLRRKQLAWAAVAVAAFFALGAQYASCDEWPDPNGPYADGSPGQDSAAASVVCRERKHNLKNISHNGYTDQNGYHEQWYAFTETDWGYVRDTFPCHNPGRVRWRNSSAFAHAVYPGVGIYQNEWYSSHCYDNQRQCLTRRAVGAEIVVPILDLPVPIRFNRCIATRVGPGGQHSRAIHKNHCDEITTASVRADAGTRALRERLYPSLTDFVGPAVKARVERACEGAVFGADPASRCTRTVLETYRSLSPDDQARIRELIEGVE
jgi:hypothetical protein